MNKQITQAAQSEGKSTWRGAMRKVIVAIVGLAIACAIATVFLLDAAASRIVSTAATSLLGTTTTIRSLHLGIFDGRSVLDGLRIEEPAEFPAGEMITVGQATVSAGLKELLSDDIVIESIEIKDVTVNLVEVNGKLNLQVVAQNIAGDDDPAHNPGSSPAAPTRSDSRSVLVRKLVVSNITVTAAGTTGIADGKKISVTIPDISVEDLGTKTTVADISAQLGNQLVERLLVAIVQAKIEGLPSQITSGLNNAASTLQSAAQSILDTTTKEVGDAINSVGDAFKGLLGPDGAK